MGQAKSPSDEAAVSEQLLDLLGPRIGRNIEIFRFPTQEQITYSAPD